MGEEKMIFMKQLVVDGDGAFTIVRIRESLRDTLLADDWQDATEEEYREQFANRTAPVESEADKALGDEPSEDAEAAETEAEAGTVDVENTDDASEEPETSSEEATEGDESSDGSEESEA